MFKRNRNVLSIDLGESTIKAVELEVSEKRITISKAREKAMPKEAFLDRENREAMKQASVSALSSLMSDMGIIPNHVRHVISSIPGDKVSLKQIKTMQLSDDELRSALAFEARKHVPIEGEWIMDFQVLRQEGNDLDVMLAVASKEAVKDHLDTLTICGFAGSTIDAPALAIANAFLLNPALKKDEGTVLFIHIGATQTHVCLVRENGLFFSREIPIAGNRFTSDLSAKLKLDISEAERIKLEKGADYSTQTDIADRPSLRLELASITTTGQTAIDDLIKEIHRSIRFYSKETGSGHIDIAVLSGGGAKDKTLCKRISEALKIELITPDPFAGMSTNGCSLPSQAPQFMQAMGMALRGLHDVFPDQFK